MNRSGSFHDHPSDKDGDPKVELLPSGRNEHDHRSTTGSKVFVDSEPLDREIKGWPLDPQSLKKRWRRKATLLVDLVIALVPLLFIGTYAQQATSDIQILGDKPTRVYSIEPKRNPGVGFPKVQQGG